MDKILIPVIRNVDADITAHDLLCNNFGLEMLGEVVYMLTRNNEDEEDDKANM